ncbi:hypothetical protein [Streptomyces eurythermus]|uniref:hypothetical protein n=1 Tax=Streptomyces eurythermus TaxID=42237 RepID=UPI0036D438AB
MRCLENALAVGVGMTYRRQGMRGSSGRPCAFSAACAPSPPHDPRAVRACPPSVADFPGWTT